MYMLLFYNKTADINIKRKNMGVVLLAVRIKYDEKEKQRLYDMMAFERKYCDNGYRHIAGIDEVGRGPLAGPVVAAVAILDKDVVIPGINDSKKLSQAKREFLYNEITEKAIDYGIGIVSEKIIDEINILNATYKAMEIAISKLKTKPDMLLLDAVELKNVDIPQKAIIKGDTLSLSIAAASIIAKVERDRIVSAYDEMYIGYGFANHKGYGTKKHIESIKELGLLPVHRKTFTKNFRA